MTLKVIERTTTVVTREIDPDLVPTNDTNDNNDNNDNNNQTYEPDPQYPTGDYRRKTGCPMPQGGTDIIPGVEGLILPEDADSNWNSNGDSVVPFKYKKNGREVEFDISVERAIAGTYYCRVKILTWPEEPTAEYPLRAKIQMSDILDQSNRFWNLNSTKGENRLEIGKDYWFDINANLLSRKIDVVGQTSKRGETLYIYIQSKNYSSAKFCFITDDGGEIKRVPDAEDFKEETA